jgi:hypothetical protein
MLVCTAKSAVQRVNFMSIDSPNCDNLYAAWPNAANRELTQMFSQQLHTRLPFAQGTLYTTFKVRYNRFLTTTEEAFYGKTQVR